VIFACSARKTLVEITCVTAAIDAVIAASARCGSAATKELATLIRILEVDLGRPTD
jgi:hypothetical protein